MLAMASMGNSAENPDSLGRVDCGEIVLSNKVRKRTGCKPHTYSKLCRHNMANGAVSTLSRLARMAVLLSYQADCAFTCVMILMSHHNHRAQAIRLE